ncbi:hypothetical protein [Terrabacter sp. 2RAF25]|uniref:hypothetical protein n=1 Tax=Terrabacter sp. 2RAF25 TaxID=3232998 RepID=UPI003F9DD38D
MGPVRRKAVVGALLMAYAVLLAFGQRLLGGSAGIVILVASFVVGFAWLLLLVAPWAARGRSGRPRHGQRHQARARQPHP